MSDDNWRQRPTFSRVLELCDRCQKLREGVEKREHRSFWPIFTLSLKSCEACFEAAKREKAAEFNVTIC